MSTPDAVLLLAADAKAPDEICLLRFGLNETRKGPVRVTDRSLRLVADQWRRYGRDMGFDYGHEQFSAAVPEKDKIAAGWGRVECRPGVGVFAVGVRWTDEARRKIEAKELRYTSPAVAVDEKTRELTGLENCALTNLPATLNPTPLTLSALPVVGGPGELVSGRAHLSTKAQPRTGALMNAADNESTKHLQAARKLRACLSAMLTAAQAASESDASPLKDLAAKMAAEIPAHMEALTAAFPDMGHEEPDGDEGKMEKYSAVVTKLQELTGCGDGLMGGLLALSAQAAAKVEQAKAAELTAEQVKAAKVDHMIKRTGQVGPKERDLYLTLSVADLDAFGKVAPRRFPAADAKAPTVETVTPAAPDVTLSADALKIGADLLGLRPEDVGLKA